MTKKIIPGILLLCLQAASVQAQTLTAKSGFTELNSGYAATGGGSGMKDNFAVGADLNEYLPPVADTGGSKPAKKNRKKMQFGTQIISLSPVMLTDEGIGFGLNYEMGLDKKGIISLSLPLTASLSISGKEYPAVSSYSPQNKTDVMYYFCPGLKFYPTSCFGKVKYSIGPSLILGYGDQPQYYAGPVGVYKGPNPYKPFTMGAMITNSLNINPTQHLSMGIDYGFGMTYLSAKNERYAVLSSISQLAFRIGYRF